MESFVSFHNHKMTCCLGSASQRTCRRDSGLSGIADQDKDDDSGDAEPLAATTSAETVRNTHPPDNSWTALLCAQTLSRVSTKRWLERYAAAHLHNSCAEPEQHHYPERGPHPSSPLFAMRTCHCWLKHVQNMVSRCCAKAAHKNVLLRG